MTLSVLACKRRRVPPFWCLGPAPGWFSLWTIGCLGSEAPFLPAGNQILLNLETDGRTRWPCRDSLMTFLAVSLHGEVCQAFPRASHSENGEPGRSFKTRRLQLVLCIIVLFLPSHLTQQRHFWINFGCQAVPSFEEGTKYLMLQWALTEWHPCFSWGEKAQAWQYEKGESFTAMRIHSFQVSSSARSSWIALENGLVYLHLSRR